jgi:acyl-CoA synthetase (AMP-forming)/AMP-acid ligase II
VRDGLDTSSETLAAVLQRRAHANARGVAYSFLRDGERDAVDLTYGELDRGARAIAALLLDRWREGERALLVYPPGLELIEAFFGCLYAGIIAVPVFPPDPLRPEVSAARLAATAEDAGAACVLTTAGLAVAMRALAERTGGIGGRPWISTDAVDRGAGTAWAPRPSPPHGLAMLQYTSGSTGRPKGVMVTHANLLANGRLSHRALRGRPSELMLGWLPLYHDMGLIGTVLYPMQAGFRSILMSPIAFLQRPYRWLRAISDHRATLSVAPNFGYDLCVRKISAEQAATLDLRCWAAALNGAERVRPETIAAFTRAFAPAGFRRAAFFPCYGLAEATLMVSGGPRAAGPTTVTPRRSERAASPAGWASTGPLVASGAVAPGQRVLIVDPATRVPAAAGEIGEIWVAGPCVARGYWNKPAETARTFHARTAGGEGPFLRTGDLGFRHRGRLVVVGRIKDVIVIRGTNHYPDDIERTAGGSHPSLRPGCGAAFAVDAAGEERLVVAHEVTADGVDAAAVIGALCTAIAATHQVRVAAAVLLRARTLPKTSSGKVQRHACRERFLAGTLEAIAEWRTAELERPESPAERELPA